MQTIDIRDEEQGFLPTTLRRLWHEEEGQSLVEYGLLISLLTLVAVVAIRIFGRGVNDGLYGGANTALQNLPTS